MLERLTTRRRDLSLVGDPSQREEDLRRKTLTLTPPLRSVSSETYYLTTIEGERDLGGKPGNATLITDLMLGLQEQGVDRSDTPVLGGYTIPLYASGHRYQPPAEYTDRLRVPLARAVVDVGVLTGVGIEVEVDDQVFGNNAACSPHKAHTYLSRTSTVPRRVRDRLSKTSDIRLPFPPNFRLAITTVTEVENPEPQPGGFIGDLVHTVSLLPHDPPTGQ